jgi:hypothetical protein
VIKIFDNLRLGTKLGLLVLIVMMCAGLAGFMTVDLVRRELLADRIEELRAVTAIAKGFAERLRTQVEAGELKRDEAEQVLSRQLPQHVL